MKITSFILIASASSSLAGKPGAPCSIDAILNSPNSNSRGNPQQIPGIPLAGDQAIRNIITVGTRDGNGAINRNSIDVHPHNPNRSIAKPKKSDFSLFNPTPDALLRELSPDRPDATESPLTVDAGRFALEASLFDYRRNNSVESYTYGSLNFKAGLTQNTDFQTVINLHSGGDDFTDLTFRLKWNLYGNDGGDTALALMPFIKVPTRGSEDWEGGLIIPWSTSLTDTIGLGLMAEIDYTAEKEFEFLHTAVLGFDLTGRLGAYTEYIGIAGEDAYQAYLAGGMNYAINDNLLLDFGVQTGLNRDSEDFGFFTGFTKRF